MEPCEGLGQVFLGPPGAPPEKSEDTSECSLGAPTEEQRGLQIACSIPAEKKCFYPEP